MRSHPAQAGTLGEAATGINKPNPGWIEVPAHAGHTYIPKDPWTRGTNKKNSHFPILTHCQTIKVEINQTNYAFFL